MLGLKYSILLISLTLSMFTFAQGSNSGTISDISENDGSVRIIDPKKEVPVAKAAAIDTEKFELGLFAGLLAVEDFSTNPVLGLSFSYHMTPSWLFQINYAESDVDKASFEENSSSSGSFLADEDRVFEYYNVLTGYRILRGRSFFGVKKKYNSDIYFLAGLGKVDFAGDSNTSFVVGTSYRVVLTDAIVANLDIRGHSVERDFLDDNKRTFNTEYALGINVLF